MVKSVTVRAVEELGVFGGLKKLNFFFDSVILSSVSSDGPTWYLQRPQKISRFAQQSEYIAAGC